MRGLLTKDYRLIAGQKKFFFVVIFLAVVFLFSRENSMFGVGYVTMLCSYFTMTTLYYDECNRGNSFLFTLPFSRKQYVVEKYLMGLLLGGTAWLCATILGAAVNQVMYQEVSMAEWLLQAFLYLVVLLYLLALTFPIEFKFGASKGRIVVLVLFLAIFMSVTSMGELAEKINLNLGRMEFMLQKIPLPKLEGIIFAVGVLLLLCSIQISTNIMEKKQF